MALENICPVCGAKPAALPHKVCLSCYNKVKNIYIKPRVLFERGQEKFRLEWLGEGKILSPETIERNITFLMKSEAERWNRIVGAGLSAVFVMIEAVDDSEPTIVFHRRRIAFMRDLIHSLDPALFAPATKGEIAGVMQSAAEFWDGKITDGERRQIQKKFDTLMPDNTPNDWNAKSIVHWMLHLQSYFDWMWYQWFESVYDAIPEALSDDIWIGLFKKHFSDEITQWVSN